MIPMLESERLILRAWRREDFPAYAAFCSDPERMRYLGGSRDKYEAWRSFCFMAGEWAFNGYGIFAVERREDRQVVGNAGLWHPPVLDEPELTWSLYQGFEKRGYAVEAARTVQRWAAGLPGLSALMSFCHPENLPSQAVAKRLGASPMPPTTLRGEPRLRFRHVVPAS